MRMRFVCHGEDAEEDHHPEGEAVPPFLGVAKRFFERVFEEIPFQDEPGPEDDRGRRR